MKGEGLERPDWQSRSSFPNRLVSPHRMTEKCLRLPNGIISATWRSPAKLPGGATDMVATEKFYQHAEHCFRVKAASAHEE